MATKTATISTIENDTTVPTPASPFFNGARELARWLGFDAVTIRRLMRKKQLPFIKVGGRYLFKRSEIEEFLERRHVPATWQVGAKKRG